MLADSAYNGKIEMPHAVCQVIIENLPLYGGGLSLALEGMVKDREVVTLMLGLAALLMALRYRKALAAVPGVRWWVAALLARLVSWGVSILEAFFWPDLCNLLEHLLLTASTILIAIGCWSMYRATRKERPA